MVLLEIVRAALEAIQSSQRLLIGLLASAVLLVVLERLFSPRLSRVSKSVTHGFVLLGALAGGLVLAGKILWLCDDAFISFRYARNFARGEGLVYNAGEWVEGYTNFLWTFVLGLLAKAHVSIPHAGLFGNLVAYVLAIVFVALAVREASPKPGVFPFAALALAGARPFYTFASSGLETMPAAMLVAAAIWASRRKNAAFWTGLLLVAAILTRPDHLLIYGAMGLAFVAEDLLHNHERSLFRRLDIKRYFVYGLPLVLIYVPYFLWRWHAYGDFFPNTYYAKSGDEAYWSQGGVYLVHFLLTTGAALWLPLFLLAIPGRTRSRAETRLRIFALLSALIFGQYVVKVGGDFMEHRFFISLLPILAASTEVSLRWRLRELGPPARAALAIMAAATVALVVLPVRVLKPYEKRWNLAEENTFYPLKSIFPLKSGSNYASIGDKMNTLFVARGLKPRLAIDCIGLVGWYADLPIVDAYGLANRRVAHKPITKRGRPGHEKRATLEDLLAEGAVVDNGNPWGERFREKTKATVDGNSFHFIRWDPDVIKVLRAVKGAQLPDPARDITDLAAKGTRQEIIDAMDFYETFLERHPDRERLLGTLGARIQSIAEFEKAMPQGAVLKGEGFRLESTKTYVGASGKNMLVSIPDVTGATGELDLDLGVISKPEMRFALGGRKSPGIRVELVVDGAVVRKAEPRLERQLAPESWRLEDLAGKRATLRIIDEDPKPGMGLRIDGIHWIPAGQVDLLRSRLRTATSNFPEVYRQALRELPASDPDVVAFARKFALHIDFEAGLGPQGFETQGNAFGVGPAAGPIGGQDPIDGFAGGGFLNSYHNGDGAKGRLAMPAIDLDGQPISLLVGGGRDCDKVYVGLEVDGKIVSRVCGKNDEVLRPVELVTALYAGKKGKIVFVDESTGGWGHLLADDVLVLAPQERSP